MKPGCLGVEGEASQIPTRYGSLHSSCHGNMAGKWHVELFLHSVVFFFFEKTFKSCFKIASQQHPDDFI